MNSMMSFTGVRRSMAHSYDKMDVELISLHQGIRVIFSRCSGCCSVLLICPLQYRDIYSSMGMLAPCVSSPVPLLELLLA